MNGLKAYLTSQFSFRAKTMDESGNRHSSENVHGFKKWSKSTEHILRIPSIKSLLFSKSTEKIQVSADQLPDGATNLRFPTTSGGLSPVDASGYTKKRSARPMRLRSLKTTVAMREKAKNWIPKLYFASMDSLSCHAVTEMEGKGIHMASTPVPRSTTLVTDVHTDTKSSECLVSTSGMLRSNEKSFVQSASSKLAGFQVDKPGQLFNAQSKDASSPCVVTSEKHTSETDTDGLLGFISPEPPSDINITIKCVLGTGANGFCYEVELRRLTNNELSCFAVNQRNSSLPRMAALKVSSTYHQIAKD
ncbi:unnamed protein product [Dicrocoelium dendriticum]|nr:unnamed protein product [Dicrocoelium dendriticum]